VLRLLYGVRDVADGEADMAYGPVRVDDQDEPFEPQLARAPEGREP
jgi:hypothetical protein